MIVDSEGKERYEGPSEIAAVGLVNICNNLLTTARTSSDAPLYMRSNVYHCMLNG